MSFFAVTYTYTDDRAAQDALRPQHRAYLASLAEQGLLHASGPLLHTEPARALLLFRAESATQVAELLGHDPFQITKQVAHHEIAEWNPVIGALSELR